jgi:Fe2+ or Zn2+ uptake regulation protein
VSGPDRVQDAQRLLRDAGLRVTRPRVAVLAAVAVNPRATVVIVATHARRDVGTMSMQTVYGVLAALTAAGLVRRIEVAGSPARFEIRAR